MSVHEHRACFGDLYSRSCADSSVGVAALVKGSLLRNLFIGLVLFTSLFIAGTFSAMSPALAGIPAHPTAVAGVEHGYSAPRHFGESPQAAVKRSLGQCGSDKFCAWHAIQWQGEYDQYYPAVLAFQGYSLPGTGDNNTASSWFNNAGCGAGCNSESNRVFLYDSSNCVSYPWYRSMVRGQIASAEGSDWNDRVSSYNGQLNLGC